MKTYYVYVNENNSKYTVKADGARITKEGGMSFYRTDKSGYEIDAGLIKKWDAYLITEDDEFIAT
jgi:hypothetical protein